MLQCKDKVRPLVVCTNWYLLVKTLYLFLHLKNIPGEVRIASAFWKSTAEQYFQNLKKKLLQDK